MSQISIKEFSRLSQQDALDYLNYLNKQYQSGQSVVDDEVFDNYVDMYESKFKTKFDGLTLTNDNYRNKCDLPYHMNSLDKVTDKKMLDTWIRRINKDFNSDEVLITDKIDGISMMLQIKDGEYRLYTRGKNKRGTDVSHLFPYINFGVKTKELLKYDIEVRGELVCPKEIFEKKYKNSGFSNARNLVGGTVVAKEFDKNRVRDFVFVGYEVYEKLSASNMLKVLSNVGLNIPQSQLVKLSELSVELLTKILQEYKKKAIYEMDGIVLACNERLSVDKRNIDENPKHMIAFKIRGETTIATVEKVEWNLSKNGIYKPRVKIHPVVLNDVVINYTSGFNAKFIVDNEVGEGAEVVLTRAGDVIPDILQVIRPGKLILPERYKWNDSKIEIIAMDDDMNDDSIIISQFVFMFKELEIKNMGESTVTKIVEAGFDTVKKLLKITKDDLLQLEGIKDKSAERIMEAIDKIRAGLTQLDWMVVSCVFPNLGRKLLGKIMESIPNATELDDESLREELIGKGFKKQGEIFADNLPRFKKFYSTIKDEYKKEEKVIQKKEKKNNKFKDLIVVFTGVRDKELEQTIIEGGGQVVSGVSKKVNLVIAKDINSSSNTIKKADELEIQIVAYEEFKNCNI